MSTTLTIEQQRAIHQRLALYHLQKAIDPTAPIAIPHSEPISDPITNNQSPITNNP